MTRLAEGVGRCFVVYNCCLPPIFIPDPIHVDNLATHESSFRFGMTLTSRRIPDRHQATKVSRPPDLISQYKLSPLNAEAV